MGNDFKIEKNISIEDIITLDILENFSIGLGNKFHSKASTLLTKLKNRKYSPIFTKLNMEDISSEYESMIQFEDAIINQHSIQVNYTAKSKSDTIIINPIKIVNFEGLWYLVATDKNDKLKSYYIKNIELLKILDTTFNIPQKVEDILNNAISIWFSDDEPFEVIMEIDNQVAKYFLTKPISNTQKIIHEDNEKLTISVMASSDWEIIPIIKSWIPFIKVISPIRIHDTVKEEANKFLDL